MLRSPGCGGSTGSHWPLSASCFWRSAKFIPAPTVAVMSSALCSTKRLSALKSKEVTFSIRVRLFARALENSAMLAGFSFIRVTAVVGLLHQALHEEIGRAHV